MTNRHSEPSEVPSHVPPLQGAIAALDRADWRNGASLLRINARDVSWLAARVIEHAPLATAVGGSGPDELAGAMTQLATIGGLLADRLESPSLASAVWIEGALQW